MFGNQWTQRDCEIKGITCDSRRIKKGYIFVCIKGENDSGYRYIYEAEKNGAVAVVANSNVHCKIPVILCSEPRKRMAELAKLIYDRPDEKLHLTGVTGTNGKTSVTHLIRDILVHSGENTALIGTNGCYFNNSLTDFSFTTSTTPESCQMLEILGKMRGMGAQNAVCEASSHALWLDRLYGFDFDVGVFTNLTSEHLDFHLNMENYFEAKKILFKMCKSCVINTDDEYGKRLYNEFGKKAVSVGFENADITAFDIRCMPSGTSFKIKDGADTLFVRINLIGKFSVYNALCAYAACRMSGLKSADIINGLKMSRGVKGRLEYVPVGQEFSIVIDYAHTSDGLFNIISTLKNITDEKVITLFGCGGNRDKSKRKIMGRISGELSDFTIITSDNPRLENPIDIITQIEEGVCEAGGEYAVYPDRYDAIDYALSIAKKGDIILLAGKGHEDYMIKGNEKIHFDEREVIRDILFNKKA